MRGHNDAYIRRKNIFLGKNGDSLLADPTTPLQPATKQYVDNLVASATSPTPIFYPMRSQGWYQCATHRHANASTGLIAGVCRVVPMYLGERETVFDAMGFPSSGTNAGQAARVGFYSLDDQLMPVSLLRSLTLWTFGAVVAGNFANTTLAALGESNVTIPEGHLYIGVAVRWEGFVGTAGGVTVATTLLNNGMTVPYGHVPTGATLFHALAVQSTDVTPGAMPAANTFTTANFTTADWGFFLRSL